MLITPLSWLVIRYVHDLEEDAWSRLARKRRKTPRMGNTLKNGEAHYNSSSSSPKAQFSQHPLTFCSRFWCRRVTKLRPDPKLTRPSRWPNILTRPDMYIFITVSIGFTKISRLGPTRRPDHFDPTRRHLCWDISGFPSCFTFFWHCRLIWNISQVDSLLPIETLKMHVKIWSEEK